MPGAVLCKPRKIRIYAFKKPHPRPAPPAKAMQKPRFNAETRLCGIQTIQNALSKKLYSARCQLPMEW